MSDTVGMTQYVQMKGGVLEFADRSAPPIQVRETPVILGRDEGCDIVVRDGKVSSFHARFMATERGVRVEDLGSTNGLYVNGVRVVDAYLIREAVVQLGEHVLSFTPTQLQVEVGSAFVFGSLVGSSPVMQRLFGRLGKIAATDRSVLITGETGTGKELVAEGIHHASKRASAPFAIIDCASISSQLAESELFGHERGSFTGAIERRKSPFLEASGGTVFLDEIGELPLDIQPKLLRVLQEGKLKPVGSNTYVPVDVRIIAATRRDLEYEVAAGKFRPDLYFRLSQVCVNVPPLRERTNDIPHLVARFAQTIGKSEEAKRFSDGARSRMLTYGWPGNVRELRNVVETALIIAGLEETVGPIEIEEHLASKYGRGARTALLHKDALDAFERTYWCGLHVTCEGNQVAMAKASGMSRAAVQEKLKKYGPTTLV